MTSERVLYVAQGLLVYAVIAALYVAVAHVLARRFGTIVLGIIWVLLAALFGVLAFRIGYLPHRTSGNSNHWVAFWLGVMFVAAFGFAGLSVWFQLRREPAARLTTGLMARGVAAFFGGLSIPLVFWLVLHAARVFDP